MNWYGQRIPTHDYLGRKVNINDKATIFTRVIKQIGGKRWFVVDEEMKIGGLGNCFLIKDE
ncbi:hypothetical protein [Lentibacillus salinarum]|uniref:DUF5348 domain-containing protein n=1 Tax=Lentibacillus salinarum TaxID=446820 RepID=A0ABW3ZYP4_9BACI